MELKELSRRISRYRANVENLQLEKNRLLNEIDALDQEALKKRNINGRRKTGLNAELII